MHCRSKFKEWVCDALNQQNECVCKRRSRGNKYKLMAYRDIASQNNRHSTGTQCILSAQSGLNATLEIFMAFSWQHKKPSLWQLQMLSNAYSNLNARIWGNRCRWLADSGSHADYKYFITSITDSNPVELMQHAYQLHCHLVSDKLQHPRTYSTIYTDTIFLKPVHTPSSKVEEKHFTHFVFSFCE